MMKHSRHDRSLTPALSQRERGPRRRFALFHTNAHGERPPKMMKHSRHDRSLTPALSQRERGPRRRFALFHTKIFDPVRGLPLRYLARERACYENNHFKL